jgi:anti-anti-sigma factor
MKTTTINNILICYPVDRIDYTIVKHFDNEMDQLMIEYDHHNVIINLSDVSTICSAGFKVFMTVAQNLKSKGLALIVVNPQEVVMKIITILGLDKVIPVLATEEEAIRMLSPDKSTQGTIDR